MVFVIDPTHNQSNNALFFINSIAIPRMVTSMSLCDDLEMK